MKNLNIKLQIQFDNMCQTGKLFVCDISGHELWDLYLSSFKREDNPVFRDPESTTHNCNHCNNFIRRYGNIVAVNASGELMSIFDVEDEEYNQVIKSLSQKIKSTNIKDVFFETYQELQSLPYESCSKTQEQFKLGIDKNVKRYTKEEAEKFGVVKPNEIRTFDHFHLSLSKRFVDFSGKSIEAIQGLYRDKYSVFKRAIEEISLDTLNLVKDLINQGSLLDGKSHLHAINAMIIYKSEYNDLKTYNKDNWFWETSYSLEERIAKFKNTLIGVLCSELAEGEELNKACSSWNKRVDPVNYMKALAPITQKQIEEAKKFVQENGYEESFDRRFATIDDIKVSEIRHINSGEGNIKSVSIFDGVKSNKSQHKRNQFEGIDEVNIEKFMTDILPSCSSVEVFVENKMDGNFVSLTTAKNPDSKQIFKWNNNYSWTFKGNLAGKSQIKEAVKSQGGIVDGVLRFSVNWSGEGTGDNSDLDAHALEPNGQHIYYGAGYRKDSGNQRTFMSGQLDIDITNPQAQRNYIDVVENIAWNDINKMKNGIYTLWVNQYSARGSKGFIAEIEFDDQIFTYKYEKAVSGNVKVAEVTLKDGQFSIKHILHVSDDVTVNKTIYGIESNQFHKVNLICLSPNHWDNNNVGNKHYLFMIQDCKSDNPIRGFHNENLITELLDHRKVMEVLGATNMIESSNKQLSGLGFNSTVRDEMIVKLSGNFKRMLKVKF